MAAAPKKQLVFVYGSLKRGYALAPLLAREDFRGEAATKPWYRMFDLGSYPGLIEWPSGLEIHGEVYAVSASALSRLDEAEGVAEGLYVRRPVALQGEWLDQPVEAWFWLGRVAGMRDCGHEWP
jgi:gamma-glutamylcyclotransferase (GGCT)/AIG2-like uncharacterized protein YtfP